MKTFHEDWPHLMEVWLGCEGVLEWVNVIEPMAERLRTDSTDVEDTEDADSCHKETD